MTFIGISATSQCLLVWLHQRFCCFFNFIHFIGINSVNYEIYHNSAVQWATCVFDIASNIFLIQSLAFISFRPLGMPTSLRMGLKSDLHELHTPKTLLDAVAQPYTVGTEARPWQ